MKPLDPRLLRYAKTARKYIIFITLVGFFSALAVIGRDLLIAASISPFIKQARPGPAGTSLADVAPYLWALIGVTVFHAAIVLARNWYAQRAAYGAIHELRTRLLRHATALGPRWLAQNATNTVTTATRALPQLQPYFVLYLPQLLLSVTVTPATLLVMLYLDWISALAALIGIPLIPIFMILIGLLTQEFSNRRLATMKRMGRQLIDLLAGLTTLKALGRENGPAQEVEKVGRQYTHSTLATLRIAFLSGAVLEFIATLSVAIVAVEVGVRLMYGRMDLFTALVVIMLAPEVFEPLRQVGKHFHASADGVAAAEAVFSVLDQPLGPAGQKTAPQLQGATINVEHLHVAARGAWAPADLSFHLAPASINVLAGPSGVGKTTTAMALLKLQNLDHGTISITQSDGTVIDLAQVGTDSWWQQCTWVPQQAVINPGTIIENICGPGITQPSEPVLRAAQACGFDQVVKQAPQGWQTPLGQGGLGLSVGQRQRLALTRALASTATLVVLDEPTAHLDPGLEISVTNAIAQLKEQGRTVLVIAHRASLLKLADQLIEVKTGPFSERYPPPALSSATVTKPKRQRRPRPQLPSLILDLDMGLGGDAK